MRKYLRPFLVLKQCRIVATVVACAQLCKQLNVITLLYNLTMILRVNLSLKGLFTIGWSCNALEGYANIFQSILIFLFYI